MSRAALLPTPGDPFLVKYWLENYAKYWREEVDKLYVYLNTPIEDGVVSYIQELIEGYGASFKYVDHQIEHPLHHYLPCQVGPVGRPRRCAGCQRDADSGAIQGQRGR